MATLNATSTLAQVQAAYDDNASYEEDGSVSKAKAFITASKILLRRMPLGASAGGGTSITLSPTMIRDEMLRAQVWLSTRADLVAGGAGAKHFSIEDFRR